MEDSDSHCKLIKLTARCMVFLELLAFIQLVMVLFVAESKVDNSDHKSPLVPGTYSQLFQ